METSALNLESPPHKFYIYTTQIDIVIQIVQSKFAGLNESRNVLIQQNTNVGNFPEPITFFLLI